MRLRRDPLTQYVEWMVRRYIRDECSAEHLEETLGMRFADATPAELIRFDGRRWQRVPAPQRLQGSP